MDGQRGVQDDPHLGIECGECGRTVGAKVVGRVAQEVVDGDIYFVVSLMECPVCGAAIVAGHSTVFNGPDFDEGAPTRLWPHPPRELNKAAPEGVRRDFAEAQLCLRAGGSTAAAVMVRRMVEGIVKEFVTSRRGTLAARIRAMRDNGAIDDRLADWALALKTLGNEAAHSGDAISREDAADMLAFAEALADYLFTYRSRYEEFMARRSGSAQRIPLV
jgi:hypothetical protein